MSAPTLKRSTCPHDCPSTCALSIEVLEEQRIGRVYGDKSHPYTAGVICAKVSRYSERAHHPDRLTRPLRRVGKKGVGLSEFEPIGWDEALDAVAENFKSTIADHSAEAIWPYHYAGTMGLIQRDSLDRFRHVLGTSLQHSTFCVTIADAGWTVGVGQKRGADTRDMVHSDLIIIWGGNPVSTQVNVMHYVSRARRENQAKLVVIDPYETGTAKKADLHIMPRPGTDGAIACAMMHVLFRDGYANEDYLQRYTKDVDALREHVKTRTPAWASDITGVSAETIERLAKDYGASRHTFIRIGYGFTRSRNGAVNMHAVSCLPAITGAWEVKGGGALYGNREIYSLDASLIKATDRATPGVRTLDQSRIGEVLCGNPHDLAGGPPVKSLFIQSTNPMVVAPDTNRVRAGFEREDLFVCVHEQFMTETAAMADIVLPATMFVEHDDMYTASGHSFFQVTKALIPPAGECRSNHWVVNELAKRLGLEHEAFHLSEWALMNRSLALTGWPDADTIYSDGGYDCTLPFEQRHYLEGFATSDRRFHFKPDWQRVGPHYHNMPALPDHWECIDETNEQHPFRLVAAPARQFLNTTFTETASSVRMEKHPRVFMHPDDIVSHDLMDAEPVNVSNDLGSIELTLQSYAGLQRGTIVIESLWPNGAFGQGAGVNTLVSSEPAQPNGGAVFHDTAVSVTSVS